MTLLDKSKTYGKQPRMKRLKPREIAYIPLVTLTLLALEMSLAA